MLFDTNAADHDPAIFADPDRLDVARRAAAHLALGHGAATASAHHSPRVELRSVLTGLPSWFPDMHLALPRSELAIRTGSLTVEGIAKLRAT